MNLSTKGIPKKGLPKGFVYIDELIPDCIIDAKYAGTDNFMGRRAEGYNQPLVVMTREAADCCVKAAEILRKQGYVMKIFDAFRPQRAVGAAGHLRGHARHGFHGVHAGGGQGG